MTTPKAKREAKVARAAARAAADGREMVMFAELRRQNTMLRESAVAWEKRARDAERTLVALMVLIRRAESGG